MGVSCEAVGAGLELFGIGMALTAYAYYLGLVMQYRLRHGEWPSYEE